MKTSRPLQRTGNAMKRAESGTKATTRAMMQPQCVRCHDPILGTDSTASAMIPCIHLLCMPCMKFKMTRAYVIPPMLEFGSCERCNSHYRRITGGKIPLTLAFNQHNDQNRPNRRRRESNPDLSRSGICTDDEKACAQTLIDMCTDDEKDMCLREGKRIYAGRQGVRVYDKRLMDRNLPRRVICGECWWQKNTHVVGVIMDGRREFARPLPEELADARKRLGVFKRYPKMKVGTVLVWQNNCGEATHWSSWKGCPGCRNLKV